MNSVKTHDANEKNDEFGEVLKEWLRYSKTHGLDRLVLSKNLAFKAIWILALLASAGVCSLLIARMIADYLRFEVKTQIREVFVESVPFPTISVCNINPFVTPEANEFIKDYFQSNFNVTISKFADLIEYSNRYNLYDEMAYMLYSIYDPLFNVTKRQSFGYTTIFGCKFSENDCNKDNLIYMDPAYGNCILLNAKKYPNGSNRTPYRAYLQGIGLSFVSFVGLSDAETSNLFDIDGRKGLIIRANDFDSDDMIVNQIGVTAGSQV